MADIKGLILQALTHVSKANKTTHVNKDDSRG